MFISASLIPVSTGGEVDPRLGCGEGTLGPSFHSGCPAFQYQTPLRTSRTAGCYETGQPGCGNVAGMSRAASRTT